MARSDATICRPPLVTDLRFRGFIVIALVSIAYFGCARTSNTTETQTGRGCADFDTAYWALMDRFAVPFVSRSSIASNAFAFKKVDQYQRLRGMGLDIVPRLVEKAEARILSNSLMDHPPSQFECVGWLLEDLCKIDLSVMRGRAFETRQTLEFLNEAGILLWWHSRNDVRDHFCGRASRWRELSGRHSSDSELQLARFSLRSLGIDALPLLVERFELGEYDLLPFFDELTDGKVMPRVALAEEQAKRCVQWWAANKQDWTIPPVSAAKLKSVRQAEPKKP